MKYIYKKGERLQILVMDFSLVSNSDHPGAQRMGEGTTEAKDLTNSIYTW